MSVFTHTHTHTHTHVHRSYSSRFSWECHSFMGSNSSVLVSQQIRFRMPNVLGFSKL